MTPPSSGPLCIIKKPEEIVITLDDDVFNEIVFSPPAIPPLDEIILSPPLDETILCPPKDEIHLDSEIVFDPQAIPPTSPKFSARRLLKARSVALGDEGRKSLFFNKTLSKHRSTEDFLQVDLKGLARRSSKLKNKGKDLTKKIRKTFSFHQDV